MIIATQSASAGIYNTKHNLGSGNLAVGASTGTRTGTGSGSVFTTGTDEICVFCHTPHGANTAIPVPLWNKGTPANTIYPQMTLTSTGNPSTPNLVGHMSLACLSCHDGTQAMDNMVNGPGGGSYLAAGSSMGYIWSKNNDASDPAAGGGAAGIVGDGTAASAVLGALAWGANVTNGGMGAVSGVDAGVYDFGTDLRQNHPVGMAYGGGGCGVGAPGSHDTTNSTCVMTSQYFNPVSGIKGFFEVGTGTAGAKTNLRLYGTNAATATVECGSCHDPHSDTYLRMIRRENGVCATCHVY